MATASYGVECRECGDRIIAPECSEYAADGVVRHLWRCSKCGCEFETRIVFDPSSPLTPDLVEMFLPSSTSRLSPETVPSTECQSTTSSGSKANSHPADTEARE